MGVTRGLILDGEGYIKFGEYWNEGGAQEIDRASPTGMF